MRSFKLTILTWNKRARNEESWWKGEKEEDEDEEEEVEEEEEGAFEVWKS